MLETDPAPIAERELTLTRLIPVPRHALWRCWTEPELVKQWFCPPPWRVVESQIDLRAGGCNRMVMQGPDGQRMPGRGVYLEVVPDQRLVFTDAFDEAWVPSNKAFMVGTITLSDEAGGTRYHARVQHWSRADRDQHAQMGFHEGWATATNQLQALAATL